MVPDDPATELTVPEGGSPGSAVSPAGPDGSAGAAGRRQEVVTAGHLGDEGRARAALADPDPSVRAAAVGALARLRSLEVADLMTALADPSPTVRRRAVGEAGARPGGVRPGGDDPLSLAVRAALADDDALVAEAACWAVGEWRTAAAVAALSAVAAGHGDMRCREAAVAALGAVGDPAGLAAVLAALGDKPTVRRRAVVALAAFDGPEVDAALARALEDRDWQVREAATILLED